MAETAARAIKAARGFPIFEKDGFIISNLDLRSFGPEFRRLWRGPKIFSSMAKKPYYTRARRKDPRNYCQSLRRNVQHRFAGDIAGYSEHRQFGSAIESRDPATDVVGQAPLEQRFLYRIFDTNDRSRDEREDEEQKQSRDESGSRKQ